MEPKEEETIQNKKQKNTKKIINKRRNIIVPIVLVITIIVSYILFRGSYLEYLEIGEKYIDSFWKNTQYVTITFLVNFCNESGIFTFFSKNREPEREKSDFRDRG